MHLPRDTVLAWYWVSSAQVATRALGRLRQRATANSRLAARRYMNISVVKSRWQDLTNGWQHRFHFVLMLFSWGSVRIYSDVVYTGSSCTPSWDSIVGWNIDFILFDTIWWAWQNFLQLTSKSEKKKKRRTRSHGIPLWSRQQLATVPAGEHTQNGWWK